MNDQDKATIDRLAAQQLNAPTPQPEQNQQTPSQADTTPNRQPTAEEKAAADQSPTTEGDKQSLDPVVYDVVFGENDKRQLTDKQIAATFERYRNLNFQHSQLKPVLQVVEGIMQKHKANPEQMARALLNLEKAYEKKPTLGAQAEKQTPVKQEPKKADDGVDPFKQWEEDNAASLPPGYKEMQGTMEQMAQQNIQLQNMLQQVLARSQGMVDATRQGNQQQALQQQQTIRQTIGNNLDRAQQQLNLPDDSAKDFMAFASERGYTLDDFVDPGLTVTVMNDFARNREGPEMDRIRKIMERRQAFTGTVDGSPSAGEQKSISQEQSDIDRLTDQIYAKRGGI